MVRLRVAIVITIIMKVVMFQFQYGAIERVTNMTESENMSLFQFQYGAIESSAHGLFLNTAYRFQFQYGAIESLKFSDYTQSFPCFNSNMVRLRAVRYIKL
ncbi:Uncharacterised protein [Porphyromonas crevioricanis]|uniref:Uncharacterized protein n=1 Tax=Porphyromonas crevioricanis TaxID=393921 RepID=A0A2X4PQA5_9PORP|nr:Uncharacterised protein [Porphyromonas crevioricanis]